MVNQKLVQKLLKQLEAEQGCPVQLRIETPQTIHNYENVYGGSFYERGAVVKRIAGLEERYFGNIPLIKADVALIEGEYESLNHLRERIQELNALYDYSKPGNLAEKAHQIVKDNTQINCNLNIKHMTGFIAASTLADVSRKEWITYQGKRITLDHIGKLLDDAGLKYLKHNLIATPDGVHIGIDPMDEISGPKVADITLKLIE